MSDDNSIDAERERSIAACADALRDCIGKLSNFQAVNITQDLLAEGKVCRVLVGAYTAIEDGFESGAIDFEDLRTLSVAFMQLEETRQDIDTAYTFGRLQGVVHGTEIARK